MNTPPSASRRAALAALLAAPVIAPTTAPTTALAQPAVLGERPFTLIVPFSPGTSIDLLARLFSEHLRRRFNVAAAVENRVGGSGTIGTQAVARAAPDGHTLLVTTNTFVTTPSLIAGMTYDPLTDFAPVSKLATSAMALCVHPSLPAASAAEFVALARARPGRIDYASIGNGSPQHLAMALFAARTGIALTHVPYRGSAGALQDLTAGTVTAMFVPLIAALPLGRDGRLRVLAIAGDARAAIAPDLPTLAEAGFPGPATELWFGLLAPARTPPAAVRRLNEEVTLMLADPPVAELLARQALVPTPGPPEAFGAFLAADRTRWETVIREANITAD